MKNIFDQTVSEEIIQRINLLQPNTTPNWGKMSVDQMLAHCNITYELVYSNNHPKPTGIKKWILKTFIKNIVVGEKPFKKNSKTAPEFLIVDKKNFTTEKDRLTAFITKTQELGAAHFNDKELTLLAN